MLRAKSPFKKRSPKLEQGEEMPVPARPPLHHYSSVQEFQELQKQQHLLNGNAWAQQKNRWRTNSLSVEDRIMPKSTMDNVQEAYEDTDYDSSTAIEAKTPRSKKKIPAPLKLVPDGTLKLVPDGTTNAIPTQRDSLESKKHRIMQAKLNLITHDNESREYLRASLRNENASAEHIARPKSPGKKLFQKFFHKHTSSETPPKISPEFEITPEKAAKILGKESLSRKKELKPPKNKRTSEEAKLIAKLEFKCAGPSETRITRSRANTDTSTDTSPPTTAEFNAPTDREIRSIGDVGRHAARVPTTAVQRTVSETATTSHVSTAAQELKDVLASHSFPLQHQHKHLQYLNNSIPPTPPSKDSRRALAMRPPITEVPSMDVSAMLNKDDPQTPDTAFRVVSKEGERAPPPAMPLSRYGNEYLNIVLNKPGVPSLRGGTSLPSAYGFVISPSAELANGSSFGSPARPHFFESPVIPRSAGLPGSRDASFGSTSSCTPNRGRALSRRWSDTSLAAWKVQSESAVSCLPPTFYSPYNYTGKVPARYRNFTRPSANDDPSLYYLPQAATTGDLESNTSRESTPPTTADSSFATELEATPVSKPQRRFLVKKRCSSNIAEVARKQDKGTHGLGLSPLIDEAMHHVSHSSSGSDEMRFDGPASAVPPPLSVSLPAKEELDAFMTLHMHLEQSTDAIHRFVNYKFEQNDRTTKSSHDEVLKVVSASLGDVLAKVNGIDERNGQVQGIVQELKADMHNKVMNVLGVVEKALQPIGQILESNAQLEKSIGHLIARISELEQGQKELVKNFRAQDKTKEPTTTLPPFSIDQTPAQAHHQHVSYPSYYASPPTTSGPVYPYVPYFDQGGWTGQTLDPGFVKMSRDQRAQHMQGRYGAMPMPTHPAYKNGDRKSGGYGKDGAHDV